MKIQQIINKHRNSNSFLIELGNNKVVLVDVGDFDKPNFIEWMEVNNKTLEAVILTHEHSDHCCGVNALSIFFSFKLYCSKPCLINIADSKQNFSYFINEIETFEINFPNAYAIRDKEEISIADNIFTFIETPGHSPGSICVFMGRNVFTGDTILNKIKTPLTFPHSNKQLYQNSIQKMNGYLESDMTIYPGHDMPFIYQNNTR